MDIAFYHLTQTPITQALPKLMEKVQAKGWNAVIRCQTQEQLDTLNEALWTYSDTSFLPHGSTSEGRPEQQPIYLTLTQDDHPNNPQLLAITQDAPFDPTAKLERILYLFDEANEGEVASARQRWKSLKDTADATLTYWQQTQTGGWEQKA